MTFDENKERLDTVIEMIDRAISQQDMLMSTVDLLLDLRMAAGEDRGTWMDILAPEKKIIISCGAEYISENLSTTIALIECPDKPDFPMIQFSRATSTIKAEYETIYSALLSFVSLINSPKFDIEVRMDSLEVINQINGNLECPAEFKVKRDTLRQLVESLPVNVSLVWRPKCSTGSLKWIDQKIKEIIIGVEKK